MADPGAQVLNNTLTGLGLALVLALAAALVGPLFVNWTAYRDDFARQASAIVGAPVALTGAVDARLLPSPYVRFRGLTSGAGATRLTVDEVEVELAIAPLLRGEIRAARLKLVRPRLGAELAPDGTLRTAFSSGRANNTAERASIDSAEIIDGLIRLATPAGAFEATGIAGLAEAGSLAGPFKFEGTAAHAGSVRNVRLATTRADAGGALRAKLFVEKQDRSEVFEADGAVKIATRPTFDGRATLSRPARANAPVDAPQPWRIAADVKGADGRLRMEALDAAFGLDDRAIRLGGRGEATLGERPRLELSLESRQVDLDRYVGQGRPKTPAAMLARLVGPLGASPSSPSSPLDTRVTLDIRGLVLAGDVAQDLKADVEAVADQDWRIRRASATLPGGARVSLAGAVSQSGGAPSFSGDLDFSTSDLGGLRRWLAGGVEQGAALARRLSVKGALRASATEIDIDSGEFMADGARSTGHVAWRSGERDRAEVALDSDRLDLDALGVDRLLSHAFSQGEADVTVALDARTLVLGGVEMKEVSLDGMLDQSGIDLKSLSIRDAGGARISGAGRIAPGQSGPEGALDFKVEAADIRPLIALARAAGAGDEALAAVRSRAAAISPVALELNVQADAKGRRLTVAGDAGGGRIDARMSAEELSLDAPSEFDVTFRSADGRRFAALLGVPLSPVSEVAGGEASARLVGAPAKGMTGEARLTALGLDLSAKGSVALAPVAGLSAQGDVTLRSADLSRFGEAIGRLSPGASAPLPASLAAKLALSSEAVRLEELSGDIAGRSLTGRLTLPLDAAQPLDGAVRLAELPVSTLAGLMFSPDAVARSGGPGIWPDIGFGASPLRGLSGRIDVAADRAPLAGGHVATGAKFRLKLRRDRVALEDISAEFEGGRLTGSASVARSEGDASLNLALQLDGIRAERLTGQDADGAPLTGLADLKLEAQGTGKTFSGLAGALTGAGVVTLRDGALKRLDVAAIDKVEPEVEAGLALEAPKVAEAIARGLDGADLAISRATAPFTISAGVARTGGLTVDSAAARIGGGASLDLKRLVLDADLTLQPKRPEAPQIGVSFEGPLADPKRRIDATGFTGWLTVRAVERETRRIDAMEADIKQRAAVARQRAEEERKRADEEKKRLEEERKREEERRKVEAERKRREAEARALMEAPARPPATQAPMLPRPLDIMPPGASVERPRPAPFAPPAAPQLEPTAPVR